MSYFKVKVFRAAQNAIAQGIRIPIKYRDKITRKFIPETSEESKIKRRNGSKMYSESDQQRPFFEPLSHVDEAQNKYRSEFRRDYGRVIHSPGFRRLQGKTQLFPSFESDFFRNRLTHSLEVAQIAKAIATKINYEYFRDSVDNEIDLDLIEVAALCHDLGHPPFGHQGEEALNECMLKHGGFEGNAQTLRLLSRIEKKRIGGYLECGGFENGTDKRYGLNLTYRSLASVIKYDQVIPEQIPEEDNKTYKVHKGYYASEAELVAKIKKAVIGNREVQRFRTIECWIMDIADDIAYSTFDLEDAFKAGFLTPLDIINLDKAFFESVSKLVNEEYEKKGLTDRVDHDKMGDIVSDLFKEVLFDIQSFNGLKEMDQKFFESIEFKYLSTQYADRYSYYIAQDGYVRSNFISQLIDAALVAIEFHDDEFIALSRVELNKEAQMRIEILKQIAFQTQILSPKLKIAEYRGKEIIKKIFDALIENPKLLPNDIQQLFGECHSINDERAKYRIVCDYIACMTDKYAIELYGRLTSETPETIFKPF